VTPTQAGTFPNTQVAVSTTATESNTANNTYTNPNQVVVNGLPVLTISKTENPVGNFLKSSGTGTYRITITNSGSSVTSGTITVTDTLPGGMYLTAPMTSGTFSCTGTTTVTCTSSNAIAGGGTTYFDLPVNLSTVAPGASYTNNVSVTGGGFVGPATGTRITHVDAAPTPVLALSKSGPASFTINVQGTYTIAVSNTGTGPTSSTLTVTDTLPSQMTFVSGSGTGGFTCTGTQTAGATVTCTSSTPIAAGGNATITLNVTPTTSSAGVINSASVTDGTVTASGSTGSIPISGVPQLSITKALAGGALNLTRTKNGDYTLTVANVGGGATTGTITVVDTLPPELQYVSASGGGFSCSGAQVGGATVTCLRAAALASNNTAVITLTVLPLSSGIVTNTATVTGGGDAVIHSASYPTTIQDISPLAPGNVITYTVNPTSVAADNTTTSTITFNVVRMNGTIAANDTTVTLSPSSSNGLTLSPGLSALTNASGVATFTVKSSVAQTVTFGVTASNSYGSVTYVTNLPQVTFTTAVGQVSAANSTVTTNYVSIPADNATKATVTVTLKDGSGNAVPGKVVSLTANPSVATTLIQPVSGTTSAADGTVRFTVQSSAQGSAVFTASTTDTTLIFITQTVTIQFTKPGTQPVPSTTVTATPQGGGVGIVPIANGPITGKVIAWRLRVRTGPGLNYDILGLLKFGTQVTILAKNTRGTWFQIQLTTGTAWVSAYWVRITRVNFRALPAIEGGLGTAPLIPVPSPVIPLTGQGVGIVNTYLLRVRSGPGLLYQQIGLVQEGTELLLIGRSADRAWLQIQTNNGKAWVSTFYVKIKSINGAALPTVEAPPNP
jgi:uncharacterized repeat protein (TIGR01451 family)